MAGSYALGKICKMDIAMESEEISQFEKLVFGEYRSFFDGVGDVYIARAPGRIDVMGGIADYSGSVVFEGTIGEGAVVGVQRRKDNLIRLFSYALEKENLNAQFEMTMNAFFSNGRLRSYEDMQMLLKQNPKTSWVGYSAGTLFVLLSEGLIDRLRFGFNILIKSSVPIGAGVSSSAAIEVATMKALDAILQFNLDGLELARLCQIAENRVVGAPCGIMDQVTCALGEEGKLLALLCQPHKLLGLYSIPKGCKIVGINSNVKHSVGGQRYTKARVAAFMGLKIIRDTLATSRHLHRTSRSAYNDFGGYLCNITTSQYYHSFRRFLPSKMKGKDFLKKCGETDDAVTRVNPEETYSVRGCTEHPIYENHRVKQFITLIEEANKSGSEKALIKAGKLMYASHWSYGRRCALGAKETDLLVYLARCYGVEKGIYGAKITGGGCGGTVALLIRDDGLESVREIAEIYQRQTGLTAQIFEGTSKGAFQFGYRRLRLLRLRCW